MACAHIQISPRKGERQKYGKEKKVHRERERGYIEMSCSSDIAP
jgi:hypothetical protein